MSEAIRPEVKEEIASLPHLLILYCFYRCSLLFKGAGNISSATLKLIKCLVIDGVDKINVSPIIKHKFAILVWTIASSQVAGVSIPPGPSQAMQVMIEEKFNKWNEESFWLRDRLRFNVEKVLGILKIKGTKKAKKQNTLAARAIEMPKFDVFGPEELERIFSI